MGHFDELCLLCGISPIPPSELWTDPYGGVPDFVTKLLEHDPYLLASTTLANDDEALAEVLIDALDSQPTGYTRFEDSEEEWKWIGFTQCVAIGHFLIDGDTPHELVKIEGTGRWTRRIPTGEGVTTRIVDYPNCGEFEKVVSRSGKLTTLEDTLSRTSASNYLYAELSNEGGFGNFFLSEGCFHYLQAWIDWGILPRAGWDKRRKLNFAEELYEVVNSRETGRDNSTGCAAWMTYDDIEQTLEQTQYTFSRGLKEPICTLAAIGCNASSEDLHAAMIKDHRCWMFIAPNIWPPFDADEDEEPTLAAIEEISLAAAQSQRSRLTSMPGELLSLIAVHLDSLMTFFSLTVTCKIVYTTLTKDNLKHVFRGMISTPSGCLFWVRPVKGMEGEVEKAEVSFTTWLRLGDGATDHRDDDASNPQQQIRVGSLSCVEDPEFPLLAYIKECYASDSMMNRKRIWGQVKQMEEVWKDYRLRGWQVDRFGVALPPSAGVDL